MKTINERRMGRIDGEFVVFLIGMRVNKWWKLRSVWQVSTAMPKMLKELYAHPEIGFLGGETWFGRSTMMVQYWRSEEQLMAYARNKTQAHLPAWKRFYEVVGTSGDVGIWHETYKSRPGDYEAIYVNMPSFGLGKAGESLPVTSKHDRAQQRLAATA